MCYVVVVNNYYQIRQSMLDNGLLLNATIVTSNAKNCDLNEALADHETLIYDSIGLDSNSTAAKQHAIDCTYAYHESTQNAMLLALLAWCFYALLGAPAKGVRKAILGGSGSGPTGGGGSFRPMPVQTFVRAPAARAKPVLPLVF